MTPNQPNQAGNTSNVTVYGAGSWGSAIAYLLQQNGHRVTLWHYRDAAIAYIRKNGHSIKLADATLDIKKLNLTSSIDEAVSASEYHIAALPVQTYHHFFESCKPLLSGEHIFANCSKGIHVNEKSLISQLFQKHLPDFPMQQYATLSGPGHAEEIARQIPTAVTVASQSSETAQKIQNLLF